MRTYFAAALAATLLVACSRTGIHIHHDGGEAGEGGAPPVDATGGAGGAFEAGCPVQVCPPGYSDTCIVGGHKDYCCGGDDPSGFAPACAVDAGFVTFMCPPVAVDGGHCEPPCAIDGDGGATCGLFPAPMDGG